MLNTLTTGAVIKEIQTIFVENRIPEILRCDNGTQFTSVEFQQLAIQYGFEIVTSSPSYPRGHGFVVRQVQTMKRSTLKCTQTGEDIDLAPLALRTTPQSPNLAAPAELLSGQTFKSTLPGKICPSIDQEDFRNWLKKRRKSKPLLQQTQQRTH